MIVIIPTDYNECTINNGGCDQRCVNTIPGYICECDLGYSLNSDNRSCVANANCSEGVCYCLDGFTDVSENGNGSLVSINCIGKLTHFCIGLVFTL